MRIPSADAAARDFPLVICSGLQVLERKHGWYVAGFNTFRLLISYPVELLGYLMASKCYKAPRALKVPSFNVINGGSHAGNRLACQEFMILPTGHGRVGHLGGCQNYGPFLGTLNIRCRIIIGTQKQTIISTSTHLGSTVSSSFSVCFGSLLISKA